MSKSVGVTSTRKCTMIFVGILLSILVLNTLFSSGYAQGTENGDTDGMPTPTPTPLPIVIEVDVKEFSKEDIERVRQINRFDISFSVPAYNQADWPNVFMQTCGESIAASGCALTSATMIFGHYGSSMNPPQVNTCMGSSACPWIWSYSSNCTQNRAYYAA